MFYDNVEQRFVILDVSHKVRILLLPIAISTKFLEIDLRVKNDIEFCITYINILYLLCFLVLMRHRQHHNIILYKCIQITMKGE